MKIKLKKHPNATYHVTDIKEGDIRIVPLGEIKLWKNNPRKNDQAAERLAKVIGEHGQITSVVVWKKNNVIYKGNTTYKALKLNGAKFIRAMFVDFPSEAAAVSYGIADNRSGEFSYWDDEVLEALMASGELNYQDLGFTKKEFKSISLLPDLDIINKRADGKELLPLNSITVKCETDVLDELKHKIAGLVDEYGEKAVMP